MKKQLLVVLTLCALTEARAQQNLQQVTTAGNSTDRDIVTSGIYYVSSVSGFGSLNDNGSAVMLRAINSNNTVLRPLVLDASKTLIGNKLMINLGNVTNDDGVTKLQVNGGSSMGWLNVGSGIANGVWSQLHLSHGTGSDANITVENSYSATPSSASIGLFQHDGTNYRGRGYAWALQPSGDLALLRRRNNADTYTDFTIQNSTGNIGIGTGNPTERLAVKGTVQALKVKVINLANWPDYVFDSTYTLMPLPELESYISQHKHLPSIPSALEVRAQGLDLAGNQAALLEKLEELSLYVIQLNKGMVQQQEQLRTQQQIIEQQQQLLTELQRRVKAK
ncbi:hypothetical protein MKQ70_14290 [Chitinophaga sedimenti]|uniref:hypothetical protein n=1 Tax=Chitinophaga sedimenti TaxID=2033606 RepID=UPI0020036DB9|nr:hypothetical protein [Chitinophaga sedimenti]MCK7556124.1 hypothetical protein [Chitinophaga sedimenti]